MENKTLLVVDDDRLVLATLTQGLKGAGYTTMSVGNGQDAIDYCRENGAVDLALLDIRMPGLSGIETARILSDEFSIPFLMLTAYGDKNLVSDAVALGAMGYLVKPMDVTQVIPAIESALQRAAEINELRYTEQNLNKALKGDRTTSTAVGMIMRHYNIKQSAAFEQLRKYARTNRRKMAEVSGELLTSEELLDSIMK